MVMEYVDYDLNNVFEQQCELPERHLIKLVYNILLTLTFIHEANVMHRDFKPQNILVSKNYHVKLCNFGIARTIPKQNMGVEGYSSIGIRESFFELADKKLTSIYDERNDISNTLLKSNFNREIKKRHLSTYVGSRWYRAPEVALL